jgi:ornithine decarboxylase
MRRWPELAVPETVVFRTRNLHLHDLVVRDDFRGQGLARRLVERVTENARTLNYERISLVAVGGSRTFWTSYGYRVCSEVAPPSSYGLGALYMTRRLHGTVETGKQTPD